MVKYNPKHRIKVDGKMSEKGADQVGKMLAIAAIIGALGIAIGAACFGISFLF